MTTQRAGILLSVFFLLSSANHDSAAQVNCNYLESVHASRSRTYVVNSSSRDARMKITLSCTDTDDTAKVSVVAGPHRGKTIQTFLIEQHDDYLQAHFVDVDKDGYQDMLVVTDHGAPNFLFRIWRYDPRAKRFVLALDDGGLLLYRSRFGDLVVYTKGGSGYWVKRTLRWDANKLSPEFSIEIPNEAARASDCKYKNELDEGKGIPRKIVRRLNKYCSQNIDVEAKEILLGAK